MSISGWVTLIAVVWFGIIAAIILIEPKLLGIVMDRVANDKNSSPWLRWGCGFFLLATLILFVTAAVML